MVKLLLLSKTQTHAYNKDFQQQQQQQLKEHSNNINPSYLHHCVRTGLAHTT